MIFLLDSTAFSDLMRKNPRVGERIAVLTANDRKRDPLCEVRDRGTGSRWEVDKQDAAFAQSFQPLTFGGGL